MWDPRAAQRSLMFRAWGRHTRLDKLPTAVVLFGFGALAASVYNLEPSRLAMMCGVVAFLMLSSHRVTSRIV